MKLPTPAHIGRIAITMVVVVAALFAARSVWIHYQVEPWTPDGRVRADIVQIAPDVAGIVTELWVANNQPVKRGQPLFQIDRKRYELALRDAEATVLARRAQFDQATREAARNHSLGTLVAREALEQGRARVQETRSALAQAEAARALAALNLERTLIVAPANGTLSDFSLAVGNYASAGKPLMALIDADSLRVEGYFEETKLPRIAIGQRAAVHLMGDERNLPGHVQSISAGIEDRDRSAGSNLLPDVTPNFSWVRLAQRIPVRIALDNPHDAALIAGRTATVRILPAEHAQP